MRKRVPLAADPTTPDSRANGRGTSREPLQQSNAPSGKPRVSEPLPAAQRLTREFFATDSPTLARRLIGQRLVRVLDDGSRLSGTIVETEAYVGVQDRAAHAFGGRRTPRNEAMYGPPGTAYIYFTYGMHFCMNVVCGKEGEPVAVLLRALEPLEGIERIRELRSSRRKGELRDVHLCSGPGRLCQALAISRDLNALDLTRDPRLFLEPGITVPPHALVRAARIGVGYAGEWAHKPLRWYLKASSHVSVRTKVL
jgi:DNA-3-methyladenine glycosylase